MSRSVLGMGVGTPVVNHCTARGLDDPHMFTGGLRDTPPGVDPVGEQMRVYLGRLGLFGAELRSHTASLMAVQATPPV